MSSTTSHPVPDDTRPRGHRRRSAQRPGLDHETAARLAATEYERVADLLAGLTPDQWSTATSCTGWDVRAMAGHVLGMMQMAASVPELARQQLRSQVRARRDGGFPIDALTALQVEHNAALTPQELVAAMRATGPRAARARRRLPGPLRTLVITEPTDTRWTLGYLFDTILTRDPFMHRLDITRAIGAPMVATPEHEGLIVADVVRDWAARHGQPFELALTGPIGGRWSEGSGGEAIVMDAFEFCRALFGRGPATGLLATQVPF